MVGMVRRVPPAVEVALHRVAYQALVRAQAAVERAAVETSRVHRAEMDWLSLSIRWGSQ